jgi:hypothetical protein
VVKDPKRRIIAVCIILLCTLDIPAKALAMGPIGPAASPRLDTSAKDLLPLLSIDFIGDSIHNAICSAAGPIQLCGTPQTNSLPCLTTGWSTTPPGTTLCSGGIVNLCTGNPGPQDPRYGTWVGTGRRC